jgi:hypothetical protein
MAFKCLDIRYLIAGKVGSQEMPAVGPSLAVCVENAVA